MGCSSCGEQNPNHNPLECASNLLACNNPCNVSSKNTAQCESLPSQIENFTLQFFGTVVKTEVDGVVSWSLPCSLDVGLPNNPRAIDEGLACYFLRLFHDGITGLTGPKGATGTAGTNGANAFSITLRTFTQPTEGQPLTLITQFNPALVPDLYVFVDDSGWYQINNTDGAGTLFLTLVKSIGGVNPGNSVANGKLVVPSGFPGIGLVGPQGPQGTQGVQGPAGSTFSTTNSFYFTTVGTDFALDVTYGELNFVNSEAEILTGDAGKYLVTAVVGLVGVGASSEAETVSCKIFNVSTAADAQGSEQSVSGIINTGVNQIVINVIVTTVNDNQVLAIYGKATTALKLKAVALKTTLTAVRIS
jgi:hypothetical protein